MIDFTKPFMNLGISILFKKPELRQAELFSFMNPLGMNIIISSESIKLLKLILLSALEIWLYILLAYLLVSLTIWIVARYVMIILTQVLHTKKLFQGFLPMNGRLLTHVWTLDTLFRMTSLWPTVSGSR